MSYFQQKGLMRRVEGGAYVASTAVVTGDVTLGEDVGIWFGSVVRGDDAPLTIGARTNIQDGTIMHADHDVANVIGESCTVGHRVLLHGATVGDRCLIGMGAILLAGSQIGDECIIGAGAVVKENAVIPPRSLVVGLPARVIREVTDEQVQMIRESVQGYVDRIREYLLDE